MHCQFVHLGFILKTDFVFDWEFKKLFIYLFLESREGRKREREKNINVWLPLEHPLLGTWPATKAYALTGN